MIKTLLGGLCAVCFAGPAFAQVYTPAPQVITAAGTTYPVGYIAAYRASYGYGDVVGAGYGVGSAPTIPIPTPRGYDVVTTLAVVGYAPIGRGHRSYATPTCCAGVPNAVLTRAYVPSVSRRPIAVIYTPQAPYGASAGYLAY